MCNCGVNDRALLTLPFPELNAGIWSHSFRDALQHKPTTCLLCGLLAVAVPFSESQQCVTTFPAGNWSLNSVSLWNVNSTSFLSLSIDLRWELVGPQINSWTRFLVALCWSPLTYSLPCAQTVFPMGHHWKQYWEFCWCWSPIESQGPLSALPFGWPQGLFLDLFSFFFSYPLNKFFSNFKIYLVITQNIKL